MKTVPVLSALTPAGLMDALIRDEDRVSRAMIDACAGRGDAMLDQLGPLITAGALPEYLTTGEWWLRLHAAMILGQMPSERAGRLLVGLMEWLDDVGDSNLMDWLAGKWPALFRNKPDAVREPLRALAEDRRHDWYIRVGAVEAALVFDEVRGEDAHERAIDWAAGIVADETEDWDLRLCAGSELLDRPRERHRLLLQDLAKRQAGGIANFTLDEVRRSYENPAPPPPSEQFADPWSFYSPSQIAARQERWAKEAAEADRFEMPEVREEPKVGRNDPCPCGSGRKYKKCCLAKREAVSDDELAWRRLRAVIDEHRPALMAFIRRAYGWTAIEEAWDASIGRSGIPFDPHDRGATLFLPWFCNVWSPDAGNTTVGDASLHSVVPAAAYLQRAKRVDPTFRSYVESCLAAPFSVFEILDAARGNGFRIRDLILGTEHDVSERSASATMRRGDLVIGQLASAAGVTMLEASQSFVIPPIRKLDAIALRKRLFPSGQPTEAELRAEHMEIIAFYLEIEHRLFDPPMPALTNTDGDELSLRRVVFDVSSAQEAFDALKHVALADDDRDLLHDAQRDSAGALANVRFPWLRPDSSGVADTGNTVLGALAIRGGRLTVEVNSEARELRIREIVAGALGERARYRVTELVSMDRVPSHVPAGGAKDGHHDLASQPHDTAD